MSAGDARRERAERLGLHGLVARWGEVQGEPWLDGLLSGEEQARQRRGLERRVRSARLGSFKQLADFDWSWPKVVDRARIERLFTLDFLGPQSHEDDPSRERPPGLNVVFVAQNGLGKTMLTKNLVHQAALRGHAARFVTASELLIELAALESAAALERRLRAYARPALLAIDEVGYLSYGTRHADLLFDVIRRRQSRSTVVTTNKALSDWGEVFPNAACVVALVDRLIHNVEVITLEGESYRLKESKEREARRKEERAAEAAKRRQRSGKGST